jgi:hypothetical protein
VGPTRDDHPLVRAYHQLLVWDIIKAPRLTRWTERLLNPLLGKSLVVYAHARPGRASAEGAASVGASAEDATVSRRSRQAEADADLAVSEGATVERRLGKTEAEADVAVPA